MATFTVTSPSDAVDPTGLSLREALALANASPDADTIYFGPILNDTTIVLTQGELTIASDVTIDGGELQITIDANSHSRVLAIEGGGTDATLDSLHITGGHTSGPFPKSTNGAGINAAVDTSLTLVDTVISGNDMDNYGVYGATGGGGIYAGGSLALHGSTVTDNQIAGALTQGAGILALHDVALSQSTVSGNSATGNIAAQGGGIHSGGSVTLDASTVSDNQAYGQSHAFYGGGIHTAGGGIHAAGDVTLVASTVSGNQASGDRTAYGGGLYAGNVTLTNSTLAGNSAHSRSSGTGTAGIGGGIQVTPFGVVSLTDSTLTGNQSADFGGGIAATSVEVANSIVIGNATAGFGADIFGAVTRSNGHNLFGSHVRGVAGDLENVTAQSVFASTRPITGTGVSGGVLADNGGPTATVALLDASTNPALGRGAGSASLDTDQRGEPRPAVNPDIGAFELEQAHTTLVGAPGGTRLEGSRAGEVLLGRARDERLQGHAGDDLLDGGAGDDRLRGGTGGDVLIGGRGADRFIFAEATHSAPAAPDRILDFSQRQGDRIVLNGLDGDLDRPGEQPLELIGRHRFTDAGQVMEQVIDGHTVVRVNLDDDPRAELTIQLHDAIDLHRADFVL